MAIGKVIGGISLEITPDGTADYDSQTDFPVGMYLESIEFVESAAGDILKIRDGGVSGPIMCRIKGSDALRVKSFRGKLCKPFFKQADQTFTTAANARVIFNYR